MVTFRGDLIYCTFHSRLEGMDFYKKCDYTKLYYEGIQMQWAKNHRRPGKNGDGNY